MFKYWNNTLFYSKLSTKSKKCSMLIMFYVNKLTNHSFWKTEWKVTGPKLSILFIYLASGLNSWASLVIKVNFLRVFTILNLLLTCPTKSGNS